MYAHMYTLVVAKLEILKKGIMDLEWDEGAVWGSQMRCLCDVDI